MWVHFCAPKFCQLINLSIVMLSSHSLDSCSLIISLNIRQFLSSNFIHFQNCFGYSRSFSFPHKLLNQLANFYNFRAAKHPFFLLVAFDKEKNRENVSWCWCRSSPSTRRWNRMEGALSIGKTGQGWFQTNQCKALREPVPCSGHRALPLVPPLEHSPPLAFPGGRVWFLSLRTFQVVSVSSTFG